MSTTPPIKYSIPAISADVPWEVASHLQRIYQTLGNHAQGFSLMTQKVAEATTASTTSTNSVASSTAISSAVNAAVSSAISSIPAGTAVNNQTANATYTTATGDNGAMVVTNGGAVTLNNEQPPWGTYIANLGTAGSATLTPASGTISYAGTTGAASLTLTAGESALVAFDGTNWYAVIIEAPSTGPTGVTSLNGETGAVTLTSTGGTVTITEPTTGTINLEAAGGGGGGYLKGSGTVNVTVGSYTSASITVTGATTSMTAVPALQPGTYTGSPIIPIVIMALVSGANTVEVGAYGLPGGISGTYDIEILVFP